MSETSQSKQAAAETKVRGEPIVHELLLPVVDAGTVVSDPTPQAEREEH
jgi:hypothetical protein